MSLHADLSSMQSTLDQVLVRVSEASEVVRGTDRDDLLGDLYDIERSLQMAQRRLRRALDAAASLDPS
ncbi:MAG: hypothetical protein JST64_07780 [Actinobacteria bacterium]|nr:hypothetical protein [Actinomycetota bacterium]